MKAGCSYGQGYFFARPMTEEKARPWLLAQGSLAAPVGGR
jgi:EAL domain-containing protein (putative c-di-GMP-specific phosphodiesterase class I)